MHKALLATPLLALGCAAAPNPTDRAPHHAESTASADDRAWWHDAIFYEVFVRSFADSSEGPLANDGIGDLRGLIDNLDYLNDGNPRTNTDLGVTALWLMPIAESASYHGYDVTDYEQVDREYGTDDDFRQLIEACHARGIRVIVDHVLNHCSSDHPWFQAAIDPASPYRDWFIWSDGIPAWVKTQHHLWHESPAKDGSYYYGFFWQGMPDLNFHNPAVSREMMRLSRLWLEDFNADGFRLDAIRHLYEDQEVFENLPETHAWLANFNRELKADHPDAFFLGEVWSSSEAIAEYVDGELDAAFEFQLADAIINAVRDDNASLVHDQMATVEEVFAGNAFATFLRNHDQPRLANELAGDTEEQKLAASILLTLPGIPFIYYGEEIGMTGTKPDPDIRTPMQWNGRPGAGFTAATPWRPVNADADTINVERQLNDPDSLRSRYRDFIALRNEHEALRSGDYLPLHAGNDNALIFYRVTDQQVIECQFNLSSEPIERLDIPIRELLELRRRVFPRGTDFERTTAFSTNTTVGGLSPYAAIITVHTRTDGPARAEP